jgi:hypothetical protein
MKFRGSGVVRMRGRIIANFELTADHTFDTGDPGIIERLKILGFPVIEDKPPIVQKRPKAESKKKAKKGAR